MRKSPVGPVSVNPVSRVLSFFQSARMNDTAARAIGFQRARQGCGRRQTHNGLQHLDDIIHGVFLVIENDDVVKLLLPGRDSSLDRWLLDSLRRHNNSLIEIRRDRIADVVSSENVWICCRG